MLNVFIFTSIIQVLISRGDRG